MLLLLALACSSPKPVEEPVEPVEEPTEEAWPVSIHVDRTARKLYLTEADGTEKVEPIGVGRGGVAVKTKMGDYITPTGTFTVDLVLHEAGTHNAVAPKVVEAFAEDREYRGLLSTPEGLKKLFANMNGIDFDKDGQPDRAYGSAYISLASPDVVTGPKMHRYAETARWFSIALHGTPTPDEDLGEANSGGCVHLSKSLLDHLIEDGLVGIGATVVIADGPPGA